MKSKLPKFLICENKNVDSRTFVLHTQKPKFIAEVLTFSFRKEMDDWMEKPPAQHYCIVDGKQYFLNGKARYLKAFYVIEFFDQVDPTEVNLKLDKLLDRVSDWLRNYLNE